MRYYANLIVFTIASTPAILLIIYLVMTNGNNGLVGRLVATKVCQDVQMVHVTYIVSWPKLNIALYLRSVFNSFHMQHY